MGQASLDGQFVSFRYAGGTVAAGTSIKQQATATSTTTASPAHLTASISGTFVMRNFDSGRWTMTVKNTGGTAAHQLYVPICQLCQGPQIGGAIDFRSISILSGSASGFTCRIVQGSGLLGARAECTGQTLGPGQQLKVQLNGGMSVTVDPSEGLELWPRDNYPNSFTRQTLTIFQVALNP